MSQIRRRLAAPVLISGDSLREWQLCAPPEFRVDKHSMGVATAGAKEGQMRRSSLVTILVFVAGLGVGFFARSALRPLQQRYTHATDLAAIEKLHQQDIAVTLAQDQQGLLEIWDQDAVRFNPGGTAAVGKQAIGAENEKVHAQFPNLKVVAYAAKYKNIQIDDGLACEWGEHEGQYKLTPEAAPASFNVKGLHLLKRQSDGSWKFAAIFPDQ
jgi:ketosteroid isomerase-like protein